MSDDSKRGGSFTFPLVALLLIFFHHAFTIINL